MIHCYTIIVFVQLGNAITPSVSRCFNCVFGLLRGKFHSIFVGFEADFLCRKRGLPQKSARTRAAAAAV